MTGRERLILGTKWMLENVRQEKIEMAGYWCGTSGCWLGHLAHCPALNREGLTYDGCLFHVNGEEDYEGHCSPIIFRFFNISGLHARFLFGQDQSGDKRDILTRLHTVLLRPGPFDEPEIANLDAEWAALQQALEGVTT